MRSEDERTVGCCGGEEGKALNNATAKIQLDPIEICSLSEEELADRTAWVRATISPAVLGRERLADGVALEFADAPGVADRVDEWVALERQCCSSIDWQRRPSEGHGQVRVEIRGVDPDGKLFEGWPLLEDGNGAPPCGSSGGSTFARLFRAGGVAAAGSFFVCCVLPPLLVAVFGATALAASLSWLDQPIWIGLGAIALASVAWKWMGRSREVN